MVASALQGGIDVDRLETTRTGSFGAVSDAAERVTAFLRVVYGWMAVGLAVTAVVAWMVAGSDTLINTIASNRLLFWGILGAQLGVVILLSARVQKLAPGTAAALFLGYSALTGLTMAFVLRVYTGESVATTFFVTAGTFGAMALYGTVTSRSLAGLRPFLFMGLIGIVIASVVGIFFQSDALQFVISFCGVILFTLLTAHDAQQLKAMALSVPDSQAGSFAVVGALRLYLNFINLFLFLLRFLGNRRN